MHLSPLLFHPILKPRVWGGRQLARFGKPLPPNEPIGESWELADLPDSIEGGRSVIANGPLAGRTLHEAIAIHRDAILGNVARSDEGGFPLLLKYLDARENLSVQVHPDSTYAAAHPEAHLKSEAWVVLAAEPDAVIYKGLRDGVTPEVLRESIAAGTTPEYLLRVPVQAGDCHYLPSGTCHALGAGVLVAEVQTPSDTTFRLFDWGRTGRELHVDAAIECIDFAAGADTSAAPSFARNPGTVDEPSLLCDCEYFSIESFRADAGAEAAITGTGVPIVWMLIDGEARVTSDNSVPLALETGRTVLLPAALEMHTVVFDKTSSVLRITPHES